MSARVYLAAVEDSADALGADVARELQRQDPEVLLSGVGGKQMRDQGISSFIDTSGLAILGLFDALAAYSRVKRIVSQIADEIEAVDPDVVVLIDSWGVMWRVAREIKRRNLAAICVKLIGPQVWATRPGRAKVLARWCDHLLCIHEFERPFYKNTGLPVTAVGNPAIGRLPIGDGMRFRQEHNIGQGHPIIGLLPGSRRTELKRVAPALTNAAAELHKRFPNAKIVCLPAPSVRPQIEDLSARWPFPHILLPEGADRSDAMAAMDIALACSGTVTTELAEQGVAVITGYKLGWLSWAIARAFLLRTRFISLVNVAADREIMPEFVQTKLMSPALTRAAARLLSNRKAHTDQVSDQYEIVSKLAGEPGGSSAQRAAAKILELIKSAPAMRVQES